MYYCIIVFPYLCARTFLYSRVGALYYCIVAFYCCCLVGLSSSTYRYPCLTYVHAPIHTDGGDGQGANVMSFTQYVNNRAPCVKYEFFVTYRLAADSDDDAEEYDEDEDEDAEMIVAEE